MAGLDLREQSADWNNPNAQIVSCDKSGMKYVLGPAIVSGKELTHESSGVLTTGEVVVNFALDGTGSKAFGDKTLAMNAAYWTSADGGYQTSVLNQFAIVLDGKIVEAPTVQQAITNGQGQISGNFTSKSAADLANVLRYGAAAGQLRPTADQLGQRRARRRSARCRPDRRGDRPVPRRALLGRSTTAAWRWSRSSAWRLRR